MKIEKTITALLALLLLIIAVSNTQGAKPLNSMTVHTVTYQHSTAGLVYTLYDSERNLKITTPSYELSENPGADTSYFSSAITCSISRTEKNEGEFLVNSDGKRRPAKIYRGVKATYKTDGAVYELQLENGDVISACDVARWNTERFGKPQFINE